MTTVELNSGCLTCLQPSRLDFLKVQSAENNSVEEALRKHFWFTDADLLLATLCQSCWDQLSSFHRFYVSVEKLYQNQPVIVKPEPEPDGFVCVEDVLPECPIVKAETELQESSNFICADEDTLGPAEAVVEPVDDAGLPEWSVAELNQDVLQSTFTKSEPVVVKIDDELVSLQKCTEMEECDDIKVHGEEESFSGPSEDEQDMLTTDEPGGTSLTEGSFGQLNTEKVNMYQDLRLVLPDCMDETLPENLSERSDEDSDSEDSDYIPSSKKIRFEVKSKKACDIKESHKEAMDKFLEWPGDNPDVANVPVEELIHNRLVSTITKTEPEVAEKNDVADCVPNRSNKKSDVETDLLKQDNGIKEQDEQIIGQTEEQSDSGQSDDEPDDSGYTPVKRKGSRVKTGKESAEDEEYISTHVKYACDQCEEISSTFSTFRLHAQQEHKIKAPFLMCCGTKFFKKYFLLQHVQVINNPDKFRCRECEKNFRNKEGFAHHMRNVHTVDKPKFRCRQCPKIYTSKFRLKVHMDDHANWDMQTWNCTQCGKTFSDGQRLGAHILKCWSEASNCDICRLVLPSKTALEAHNFKEHGSKLLPSFGTPQNQTVEVAKQPDPVGEPSACSSNKPNMETCPSGSSTEKTAKAAVEQDGGEDDSEQSDDEQEDEDSHNFEFAPRRRNLRSKSFSQIQRDNDDEYIRTHVKYICEICNQESQTFSQFKDHSRRIHNNASPFLRCCGRRFFKKYLLFWHVQLSNNPKAFRCVECQKNFNNHDALKRHLKSYHTGNTFQCHRCPRTFAIDCLLKEHIENHENRDKQRWKCTICLKIYQNGKCLTQHIKRCHPELPEYTCEICSKTFRLTSLFEQHKLNHRNQQCQLCPQLLPDAKSFRVHARLMHPEAIICSVCTQVLPTWEALKAHKVREHYGESMSHENQTNSDGEYEYSDDEQEGLVSLIVKSETEVGGTLEVEGQPECSYNQSSVEVEQEGKANAEKQDVETEEHAEGKSKSEEQSDDTGDGIVPERIKTKEQYLKDEKDIKEHVKYICEQCGVESVSFLLFNKHTKDEHDQAACVMCCGKKYYQRSRLLEHVQFLKNQFRCKPCRMQFKFKFEYQRHMNEYHKLRYKCDRCPKSYASKSLHKLHMEDHEGCDTKKWKCKHCDEILNNRRGLYFHIRKQHSNLPEFKCDVCSKMFRVESRFLQHKLNHGQQTL